jgi:hypothetical protein
VRTSVVFVSIHHSGFSGSEYKTRSECAAKEARTLTTCVVWPPPSNLFHDHNRYPAGYDCNACLFGSLRTLTTPIAYLNNSHDFFGTTHAVFPIGR